MGFPGSLGNVYDIIYDDHLTVLLLLIIMVNN